MKPDITLVLSWDAARTLLDAVRAARRAHGEGRPQYRQCLDIEGALDSAILATAPCDVVVEEKVTGAYEAGSGV